MPYSFNDFDTKAKEVVDWFTGELAAIRTGRASMTILDGVKVDSYGAQVPINQVANISMEDPRTIRIAPWDPSQIEGIERAVTNADLGVSASSDEKGVRVNFPPLTEETRKQILKIAKNKHEEARVSLRHERDRVWNDIQDKENAGDITEDEKFRLKDDLQKKVDALNKELDEKYEKKEKEILG